MYCSKNACPVPFDQRPLNEFYALKHSCFFAFFGFELRTYLYSMFIICSVLISLLTPLILVSIEFSWSKFITNEFFCLIFIVTALLTRLYLGWSYVITRLFSATVTYEESGWYDGQIWIKTPEILTKERLIGTYYVLPLLHRIKLTFVLLSILLFVYIFIIYLLC